MYMPKITLENRDANEIIDAANAFSVSKIDVHIIAACGPVDCDNAGDTFVKAATKNKIKIDVIESIFATPLGTQLVYLHNIQKDRNNVLLPFIALYQCMKCETVKLLVCQRWMIRVLGKLILDKGNDMSLLRFLVRKRPRKRKEPSEQEEDDNNSDDDDNNDMDDDNGDGEEEDEVEEDDNFMSTPRKRRTTQNKENENGSKKKKKKKEKKKTKKQEKISLVKTSAFFDESAVHSGTEDSEDDEDENDDVSCVQGMHGYSNLGGFVVPDSVVVR